MDDRLKNILSLNDTELKNAALRAAVSAGGKKSDIESALSDVTKLRAVLSSLSQKDIDSLIGSIGKENAERIAELIKKA